MDMLLPLGSYRLVCTPAIRRRDREAKQMAKLAVEVGHAALRPFDLADDDVPQCGESVGKQPQDGRLAGADVASDEREAAVHDQVFDAPCEVVNTRRLAQRLNGDVLEKRIPLEPEEGGELARIHQSFSLSSRIGSSFLG